MLLHRDDFADGPEHVAGDTHIIDLDALLALLQRRAGLLIAGLVIGLALGGTYIALAPKSYFANALVLIDPNLKGVIDQVQQRQNQQVDLESEVLNQMQVVQSGRIARAVVTAEKLNTDADFLNPPPSFTHRAIGLIPGLGGDAGPKVTQVSVEDAARLLARNLHVARVGRSSVISVGYQASTPDLATRIAAAYAHAFEQDQLNADLEANRGAADWLEQRLAELGENQRQASLAVEQYRQQHNLSIASSDTLSNQRLQALTSQFVEAQADLARDQALSSQLAAAVAAGPQAAGDNIGLLSAANPADADHSEVSQLAGRYAEIGHRLADVKAQFGPDHPQAKQLESEQQAVGGQIFAMLGDLNDRYVNIVKTDRGREEALRANVEREGNTPIATSKDQVKLGELQQHAAALKALYDSYLTRYEETVQRQSFPIPSVRVITPPTPPRHAASPRIALTLAAALLAGLCLGAGLAAIAELRERAFRLGQQVTDVTGLRFIGYLPRLIGRRHGRIGEGSAEHVHALASRQVAALSADSPASTFTETLRAAALLLREPRPGQGIVAGTVSALPGEGKTLFSVALAEMLASGGHRTLLIDADLRAPEASRLLALDAPRGLFDVARGTPLTQVLQRDEAFGLAILPLAGGGHGPSSDFLSSPKMEEVLHDVRKQFDYIIVDMPPVGPVVDALALLPMTDALFLVTEWGRTPRRLVRALLNREPELTERIAGVVLNKVDLDRLAHYSNPGDAERYLGTYQRYYRSRAAGQPVS